MLAAEPEAVAKAATTSWLPLAVGQWLSCLETAPKDMEGRPLRPMPRPVLSETDQKQLTQTLWMLEQAMKPASSEPLLLKEAILVAMVELPFRSRSSEEQVTLTLKVWMDACREYPLWAIQKAAGWWSRGVRDGDDLGHFLSDARLAVGGNVLARKRILGRLT